MHEKDLLLRFVHIGVGVGNGIAIGISVLEFSISVPIRIQTPKSVWMFMLFSKQEMAIGDTLF